MSKIKLQPKEFKVGIKVTGGNTNAEADVRLSGRITRMLFKVPNLDDTDTAELKLQNSDNEDIFASGELAESTTHKLETSVDVASTITFRVECSGSQTATRFFKVYAVIV